MHQLDIAQTARAAARKKLITKLQKKGDVLWDAYINAKTCAETAAKVARTFGEYPLLSGGDVNLYALFVERAQRLAAPHGVIGLVTPSAIASDLGTSAFFKSVATTGRLKCLFDFENKKVFFPDVDSRFKFCTLIFGGQERHFTESQYAFFLHAVKERNAPERVFTLNAEDFAVVNPNTGTVPIFRFSRDAEITTRIYKKFPVLVDRRTEPPKSVWRVRYVRMFDMTNDSHLFKRQDELDDEGFYPVGMNIWRRGSEECVPLYVGRMIHQFDHRVASVTMNEKNLHNPALSVLTNITDKKNVNFLPKPLYWVNANNKRLPKDVTWVIGFRDVARVTDARTLIASIIPRTVAGNTLPLLLPQLDALKEYATFAPLLLANMNTFVMDFVVHQKVHSTNINWYILEQLPFLPPRTFENGIGGQKIADFIREQVLHLTYTAVDMRPFAQDMEYDGEPFPWDEEDRRHRLARLDALFFHLYEVDKNEANYILEQFPNVRAQDEKAFGRYLTKDLILAYMNATAF
ncbi:MAG: hypothetical protein ABFS56_13740 [Pseudomonadota bacterium]